jgi:hypothetical protein
MKYIIKVEGRHRNRNQTVVVYANSGEKARGKAIAKVDDIIPIGTYILQIS